MAKIATPRQSYLVLKPNSTACHIFTRCNRVNMRKTIGQKARHEQLEPMETCMIETRFEQPQAHIRSRRGAHATSRHTGRRHSSLYSPEWTAGNASPVDRRRHMNRFTCGRPLECFVTNAGLRGFAKAAGPHSGTTRAPRGKEGTF